MKAATIGILGTHAINTFSKKYTTPGYQIRSPKADYAPSALKPIKKRPGSNPLSAMHVYSGEYIGKLIFTWDYSWIQPKETLIYNKSDTIGWLKDRILSDADQKSNYISLKKITNSEVTFVFEPELWIKDTLKGASAQAKYFKNGLRVKWSVPLPDLPLTKYPRPFLGTYLAKQFHNYFNHHRSQMSFAKHWKWLKTINPDVFTYSIDWFRLELIMTLKNSVILGALLTALGIKRVLKP